MTGRSKKTSGDAKTKSRENRFSVDNIARGFLEYFEARGHKVVPSAPLLPEDPTLLFTAAGMVPFKQYYSDPDSAPYATAASVQKCLRAGGKQSDLENVGKTVRHHTFFEMLGNFSFGDYFKKEAIEYAWDLSVDVWGLDAQRLWVSIYEQDDEAYDLWTKHMGFPAKKIVRLGKKDNFWGPVGETGVCGPCSEIHYDQGAEKGCGSASCQPGCDCDRYVEYWNLVFPQFFLTKEGVYDPLPRPGIDTGMGLERVAFILQGVGDNFHTDLFLPIRQAVENALPDESSRESAAMAVNAAADHVRALVFALSEGIMPSNEGRGYVLRRLLRRALTKMHPFGVREPFLSGAVDAVIGCMGERYPELRERAVLIKEIITSEEERFVTTLEQGLNKFHEMLERTKRKNTRVLPGEDAFVLYDTYGFPLEMTTELADDEGLEIDRAGFEKAMASQKERARGRSFHVTEADGEEPEFVEVRPLDKTEFVGYHNLTDVGEIGAFRCYVASGSVVAEVITDKTPFYPEGGGQVGDRGMAHIGGRELAVVDAFWRNGHIVHQIQWGDGDPSEVARFLEENTSVRLEVDEERRLSTARNHTGTHLLHAALKKILGNHVTQAGSLVAPDRLRFDFNHYQGVSREELLRIESVVNEAVLSDMDVTEQMLSYDDAISQGAMALFGEKYGDTVRMITVGGFSRELCGGTHLDHTGEIGVMFITHETAVAAGVRRIEALTGTGAYQYVKSVMDERASLARLLKAEPDDLERRVRALIEENDAYKRQLAKQEDKLSGVRVEEALDAADEVAGVKYVSLIRRSGDLASLRRAGDALREKMGLGVGLLCLASSKKPILLIVASDRAAKERGLTANGIASDIGKEFSLRGGGKPHLAQMGLDTADDFDKIREFVRSRLEQTA